MENEKRSLLAFALIIAFLYVWFEYFVPKPPPKPPLHSNTTTTSAQSPSPTAVPSAAPSPASAKAAEVVPTAPVVRVDAENEEWNAEFSSHGGSVEKLALKKYRVAADRKSAPVPILPFRGPAPSPLEWSFTLPNETVSDAGASYRVVERGGQKLVFEREASGLRIRKTFEWDLATYVLEETLEVTNLSTAALNLRPETRIASGAREIKAQGFGARGDLVRVVTRINEKTVYFSPDQIKKDTADGKSPIPEDVNIEWAGVESHYFLLTAIPVEGRWRGLRLEHQDGVNDEGRPVVDQVTTAMLYPPLELAPKAKQQYRLKLFAGPKDIGVLQSAGASLDRAIDLGDWLGPIARPILYFLRWLYSHVPNYGIAIILLTVLVRLFLFPLTQMQSKSMLKMQKHKPELDALKERYKDDKEAHSREMMAYMRRHKVNPMGGCLLILPQMPVLFALYRVLYNAIEIRHAPFFLWIHDLSAHDPYFVLPVLLGISMFLQQKMTPNPTADPAQQTMMKVMPIMFTGFMIFLPAGLNLYIFVSTMWGVAQQYWMKHKMESAGVGPLPASTS